jgi:hypothetical protein
MEKLIHALMRQPTIMWFCRGRLSPATAYKACGAVQTYIHTRTSRASFAVLLPLSIPYFPQRIPPSRCFLHSRSFLYLQHRTIVVANSRLRRCNNTDSRSSCEIPLTMGLPLIKPLVRVLLRTRPDELAKIHPSLDQADTQLIEKVCVELHLTNTTNVCRLITKLWDEKRQDWVDIIFDYYDVSMDDERQPKVVAYEVTAVGPALTIIPLFNPHIRLRVNM